MKYFERNEKRLIGYYFHTIFADNAMFLFMVHMHVIDYTSIPK